MPETILVATSDAAFGELLRTGLEESGKYGVTLVRSGGEVLSLSSTRAFDLAILDAELNDRPFVPLAQGLMNACPRMKVMVVPPENNLRHARLTGLRPHGYILSPFFLPDLLEGVETILATGENLLAEPLLVQTALGADGLNWAEDPLRAAQVLARLLAQVDASAALIGFEGKLWAFAGQIPEAAAQEIARALGEWRQDGARLDLARYARLHSTGGEHLIYTTALLDQLALALVYTRRAPLTRARAQAAHLREQLSRLAVPAAPPPTAGFDEPEGEEDAAPPFDLAALLAGMPSPDPGGEPPLAWTREEDLLGEDAISFPWERPARAGQEGLDWRKLLETPDDTPERTCSYVLLPALPEQHLTGALAEQISLCVRQVCQNFGWRLAALAVRPGQVQFSVVAGPDGACNNVASVVRQRTSERIFNRFPHLRAGSGDFWAPGSLELPGASSVPVESLRAFIAQTRQSQGYPASNSLE